MKSFVHFILKKFPLNIEAQTSCTPASGTVAKAEQINAMLPSCKNVNGIFSFL